MVKAEMLMTGVSSWTATLCLGLPQSRVCILMNHGRNLPLTSSN